MANNNKREPGLYWYGSFTKWEALIQYGIITVVGNTIVETEKDQVTGNLVLPEGIAVIGKEAFRGCQFLSELSLPDSLVIINEFAFFKCFRLENIHFGKNLQKIERGAFAYCKNLKYVRLPDSLVIISNDVFYDCHNLNTLKMPKNLSDIGEGALWNCNPSHVIWRGEEYYYIGVFMDVFNGEGRPIDTSYFK